MSLSIIKTSSLNQYHGLGNHCHGLGHHYPPWLSTGMLSVCVCVWGGGGGGGGGHVCEVSNNLN